MANEAAAVDYRELLEEERASLVHKLEEIGFGADGNLTYDANFADSSQVTAERGEAEALAAQLQEALAQVEKALAQDRSGNLRFLRALRQADLAGAPRSSAGDGLLHRLRLGSPLTTGARLRSLGSNPRLPTYIVFAAVGVLLIVLVIRHHVVNEDTLIFILAFAPSVILHEVSHGVVALWCGDDTAKRAGRLTLNPLKHIDPVGSIVVPVVLALSHGPIFGWAKPVPIADQPVAPPQEPVGVRGAGRAGDEHHPGGDSRRHPPRARLAHNQGGLVAQIVFEFGIVNVILAIFNLIPIPPLDGSALIERALPASALPTYYQLRMGFMVVVLLVVFLDHNLLSSILVHCRDLVPERRRERHPSPPDVPRAA